MGPEHLEASYHSATKVFWQIVKRMRRQAGCPTQIIKSREGQVLAENGAILERWKEYFDDLLNPTLASTPVPDRGAHQSYQAPDTFETSTTLSISEVIQAVQSLKSGKAGDIDEIHPEMLKALGGIGAAWLTRIFQVAWDSGEVPLDWTTGVIVPIFKKGDKSDCNNYRGITLLSLPGKAYAKVLEARLRTVAEPQLSDEQCGFRPGRSTSDQIFTLKLVCEKAWEYAKPVFMTSRYSSSVQEISVVCSYQRL